MHKILSDATNDTYKITQIITRKTNDVLRVNVVYDHITPKKLDSRHTLRFKFMVTDKNNLKKDQVLEYDFVEVTDYSEQEKSYTKIKTPHELQYSLSDCKVVYKEILELIKKFKYSPECSTSHSKYYQL